MPKHSHSFDTGWLDSFERETDSFPCKILSPALGDARTAAGQPLIKSVFGMLAISGTILTMSDPLEYYGNIAFWFSLVVLVAVGLNALIRRFGVYRTVAAWDEDRDIPSSAQYWAAISLSLWILLVFVSRAIAFF